jgi:hypothetical protein
MQKTGQGKSVAYIAARSPKQNPSHPVTAPTILTAADQAYWRCLWQFLRSAERMGIERQARIVAYDLGMDTATVECLRGRFPSVEFRRFDFSRYPPHVALATRTYAWKPMAVAEAMEEFGGRLLWLDSAALFQRRDLSHVTAALDRHGIYALKGQSALELRCNVFTLDALDVPPEDRKRPERVATVIGFDTERPAVREFVTEWKAHSLVPERIAPRTKGHNPEQALLSILLFKYSREGRIGLGEEEIDISSASPVRWITTRNKVGAGVPIWADPAIRLYYFFYKTLDQAWLGFQRRRRMGHKAG